MENLDTDEGGLVGVEILRGVPGTGSLVRARAAHSPVEACREFGGPALATVYLWLGHRPPHVAVGAPAERVSMDGVERRFRPSWELKRAVALRHVEDGERIADLAASTGYSQTAVCTWAGEVPGRRIAGPHEPGRE